MRRTCTDMVFELAKQDPRIVFVGSDLGAGLLDDMKAEMPERFYMEGVCEQNLIGMAAGLAMEGYIPYVNTIATFITRRCFEQIAIDLCLHNLPVRLIGNGGGMVYAPLGPTHMATDDIAILRALPNMTIVAPTDAEEMKRLMPETINQHGPLYIRLGKGGDAVVSNPNDGFKIGKGYLLRPMGQVLLVTTGVMASRALTAAETLEADGISCGVLNLPTIKPLDEALLLHLAADANIVVTVEEHTKIGGLGSAVTDALVENLGTRLPLIKRLGLPDVFPEDYGSQDSLMDHFGLQAPGIAETVRNALTQINDNSRSTN
jgi:transketolase